MEIKRFIVKNLKWIVLFISLILVIAIAEDVLDKEVFDFDIQYYNLIYKYLISDFATPIAKCITQLGGAIFLILLSVVLTLLIKDKKIGIYIWSNLIISTVLNQVLKYIVQRPRPMVSAAFYGFLIYLIYKKVKNKYLKCTLISLLSILVILIGTSRIYLGVHYASDVVAGFLISISYLIIFTSVIKNYNVIEKN